MFPKRDLPTAHLSVNMNLEYIHRWLIANKIGMNDNKTHFMLYSYSDDRQFHSSIKIGDHEISQCSRIRFLGLILDEIEV